MPQAIEQADILLSTLNARYIHSAFGLRYLRANLAELHDRSRIVEFTLESAPSEIAEQLLSRAPRIIGLGVYIWNVDALARLVRLLKRIAPEVILVLGGPEVSHEWQAQSIVADADYVITGQADLAFARLCRQLLAGERPPERIIHAGSVPLAQIALPYEEYSDTDLAQRVLYVEASRGCPFRCAFCLSALDRSIEAFDWERLQPALERLYQRGARQFKFVDRTFNLKPRLSTAILDFFLQRQDPELFLHFEVIPDHLPDPLKQRLKRFTSGSLQLEIGIQSLDPEVQHRIQRRQDNDATLANLAWLRRETRAHLHTDLIIGLPGEDMAGFGASFDRLIALQPQEIQVGVLKRLRGSPLVQLEQDYGLCFSPDPPYEIVASAVIDFPTLQRLKRFARYWDLLGNSGRFPRSLPLLLGDQPFRRFLAFADWLYADTGQTSHLALKRLFVLLWCYLGPERGDELDAAIRADYEASGCKGRLQLERLHDGSRPAPGNRRQLRHEGSA